MHLPMQSRSRDAFAPLLILADDSRRAFDARNHLAMISTPARELCLTPKGWPRCRARLVSSHVALAFPVPRPRGHLSMPALPSRVWILPLSVLANGFWRSPLRSRPLAPCGARGRAHLLVVRIRVRLATLAAVSTPSAHSPRAREFMGTLPCFMFAQRGDSAPPIARRLRSRLLGRSLRRLTHVSGSFLAKCLEHTPCARSYSAYCHRES